MISSLLVCERHNVIQYLQPIPLGCDVHSHDTQRFHTELEKLQTSCLSLLSVSCSPVAPSSSPLSSSTLRVRKSTEVPSAVLSALLHSNPHNLAFREYCSTFRSRRSVSHICASSDFFMHLAYPRPASLFAEASPDFGTHFGCTPKVQRYLNPGRSADHIRHLSSQTKHYRGRWMSKRLT